MRRKATAPNEIANDDTMIGKWPIDRSRTPETPPMSLQMGKALVHLCRQNGSATKRMLIGIGFTELDIAAHGDAARIRAVKLAPELAHQLDRDFARAQRLLRVA